MSEPRVSGHLLVDLSDITWRSFDVARTVGQRFWAINDAPAGAEVIVRLPTSGHDIPLIHAFVAWNRPPGRLRFRIEGPDSEQMKRACGALRDAIAAADVPAATWDGSWPADWMVAG